MAKAFIALIALSLGCLSCISMTPAEKEAARAAEREHAIREKIAASKMADDKWEDRVLYFEGVTDYGSDLNMHRADRLAEAAVLAKEYEKIMKHAADPNSGGDDVYSRAARHYFDLKRRLADAGFVVEEAGSYEEFRNKHSLVRNGFLDEKVKTFGFNINICAGASLRGWYNGSDDWGLGYLCEAEATETPPGSYMSKYKYSSGIRIYNKDDAHAFSKRRGMIGSGPYGGISKGSYKAIAKASAIAKAFVKCQEEKQKMFQKMAEAYPSRFTQ